MKVHEGKEDNKCEPGPSESKIEPGPSQSKIEPGSSQTDLVPVKLDDGNWQCPCCSLSVSKKRKDVMNKHIKEVHLGNNIHSS